MEWSGGLSEPSYRIKSSVRCGLFIDSDKKQSKLRQEVAAVHRTAMAIGVNRRYLRRYFNASPPNNSSDLSALLSYVRDRLLSELSISGEASNPENMSRLNFGIELDIVAFAVPSIASVTQQIVDLIGLAFRNAEFLDRHINVRMLFAPGIDIQHHHYDVLARHRHLPVEQDGVVIGLIKPEVVVKLQGAILAPDIV